MKNIEDYLNNYFCGMKKPTLDAMKYFMDEYNNFQENMKFIHVAGTNGKGSCVETISNILEKAGYNVGKFMSPHLIRYNERISINGKEITDEEMWEIVDELDLKIKQYNNTHESQVTLFELETIMALLYFYKNNVDFVVLETGLGGLYDCTNIITKPIVSIITSIGYDHMHILGNTLEEIAYQKAGIIKENSNTLVFSQSKEIDKVFIETCKKKNNKLQLLKSDKIKNYMLNQEYQCFDYENYKDIEIILKGKKQVENAILCIKTIEIINELGYKISESSMREGLKTVVHRGRMEILNENPLIIFDGAHNEPAIKNLQSMIDLYYKEIKKVYVISILKRKDYEKMIQLLLEDENAEFIFTSGNNIERYASSDDLYNVAMKYKINQHIQKMDLEDAINYVVNKCEGKANFFVGSFYTYGNVLKGIKKLT